MKKTLQFLVTVNVDVADGKECFGVDIGEGIQIGINLAMSKGLLTGKVNEHTTIESVTTCYSEIIDETNGAPIMIDLNIMDFEGNVVDGTTAEMTREQISDVVDHAAQLILIRRSANRSSGDMDGVLCELEEALVAADVIDQIEVLAERG